MPSRRCVVWRKVGVGDRSEEEDLRVALRLRLGRFLLVLYASELVVTEVVGDLRLGAQLRGYEARRCAVDEHLLLRVLVLLHGFGC